MGRKRSGSELVWIKQIFGAASADNGGVIRRAISSVEEFASHAELLEAVQRRGFHLIETGDQYVILCNKGAIKIHC